MDRKTYDSLLAIVEELHLLVDSAIAQLKEIKRIEEMENRKLSAEEIELIRIKVESKL